MAGVERFFGAVNGYMTFYALALGHRTGLLAAILEEAGTVEQIATRAGTHERSTREWLAVMTAAGFVRHDAGVFQMVDGQAPLFNGQVLPFDPMVLLQLTDVMARLMPELERAVREGVGVPYALYQPEFSAAQDAMNAPLYAQFLVSDWIPSVDGLAERLTAGLDVADIGCGGGRALCLLAEAFPASRFVGYDVDDAALALGRDRASAQGLGNVRFVHHDVADLALEAELDVVLAVDAVHDQARPLEVVSGVRRALRPHGIFIMVEPTAAGDLDLDVQNPMAVTGFMTSLGHCIQVSVAAGGPGLGGMWGRTGADALLADAGYSEVTHHDSASEYTVFAARP
jgi:SAM-dependent methyltransferase